VFPHPTGLDHKSGSLAAAGGSMPEGGPCIGGQTVKLTGLRMALLANLSLKLGKPSNPRQEF
jgi:hypothetical protein